MKPLKVLSVFGTRPEAVKMAPVVLAMKNHSSFEHRVCVTAQHRQMLDQVLDVFGIEPDIDLDLMRPTQTLASFTARALAAIDELLLAEKPELVLVQGDTTTVLCAALAAFYHHVPVGHVEAGLRTGDLRAPFPEEANRVLAGRLATLHFAPTATNRENLLREGIAEERIFVTGNTVVDALHLAQQKVLERPPEIAGLPRDWRERWAGEPLVLITGHRRESFGPAFENICQAIATLAELFPKTRFVYPVHLNPNVREPVNRILASNRSGNVHLIEPLPYLPFVAMMSAAKLILTDSGGIQEEGPSLGKPVLVMRELTERPEGVATGTVKLVGTSADSIVRETARLLSDQRAYEAMANAHNPYGDGQATRRILDACLAVLRPR